jgi:small-conductance mechanosensitive channel
LGSCEAEIIQKDLPNRRRQPPLLRRTVNPVEKGVALALLLFVALGVLGILTTGSAGVGGAAAIAIGVGAGTTISERRRARPR